MKLSPLLAQFLSTNKELALANIGRFILDEAGQISFEQDPTVREDPQLISFITEQSGKMKSLISSDLESHLELARQFLNIGKPFLFEGIGTLTKNKTGNYDFIQGNAPQKSREAGEGRDMTSTTENSFTDYEEMFSPKKPKGPATKKLVTWVVALLGLSFAIFGGYFVYNRTKNKKTIVVQQPPTVITAADTLTKKQDSIPPQMPVDSAGVYRFVIETAARQRAFFRYNNLRKDRIDVLMDTKDSVVFKLFFLLPAAPADTARKRDSLQRLYGTRGRTVVELN